ncbi:TAXI family TRAP transporter solute-binding subunit [Desulfofundulus sp. TPOSR]|uniref:TAXI family TRAP transporter solute-binding subunit n=1 Tax=Desulfofundulus sp. TPOSR TaxID=2714340 RepID=UPI00140A6EDC|nr:TAXI family TRAP transporter solute-binding subunit [Desulfofundulus sp. TPOSR]NHM28784.1 TAXI family TRAP transporter solute-binding subunit [Desulfofundulus sp. TPOSR]
MKKRPVVAILTVILVIGLLSAGISGCGKKGGEESQPGQGSQKAYSFATAGTGGTYYPMGGAIASIVKEQGIDISVETSGGSAENLRLIQSGQTDMAWANASEIYWAWNGQEFFKDQKIQDFRLVAFAWGAAFHWAALKESGIKTVADFAGKTVSIGPQGSGSAIFGETFLKHMGLWDKVKVMYYPPEDMADGLKNRTLDVMGYFSRVPWSAITDVSALTPVNLIDAPSEGEQKGFGQKYPFYLIQEVKSGTYKGQEKDIKFYNNPVYLVVHKNVPEEVVYKMLQAIYSDSGQAKLRQTHKAGEDMTLQNALVGMDKLAVPLHPGAEKFFKEKGMTIPPNISSSS